jgi:hypothetical protein
MPNGFAAAHALLEERLDVGRAKSPVTARGGEGREQAGPHPVDDGAIGDPEQLGDIAGGVPGRVCAHEGSLPRPGSRQSPENRKKPFIRNRQIQDISSC